MSRRAACAAALLVAASTAAQAADRGFEGLVRSLESHYGKERLHIPLFGMARFFVKVAHPGGAGDLKLAIWEDVGAAPEPGDFESIVCNSPEGWSPFVKVQSRRDRETTRIYTRFSGGHMILLIATFEQNEATLVQLKLDRNAMKKWLDQPAAMGSRGQHPGSRLPAQFVEHLAAGRDQP